MGEGCEPNLQRKVDLESLKISALIDQGCEFEPGDKVHIKISETETDGPYLVATADPEERKYTLCLDDGKGTTALDGRQFDEDALLRD